VSVRRLRANRVRELERAIALAQSALDHAPADFPGRADLLHNLGTVLRDLYAQTGELDALERAVEAHSESALLTRDGSPARPLRLDGLAIALFDRFRRTGDRADLNHCIEMEKNALQESVSGSLLRAQCMNTLGNALRVRATVTGSLQDLRDALLVLREAVAASRSDSPRMPMLLANLGLVHAAMHAATADASELDAAVNTQQRAVDLAPGGSLLRPWTLSALGDSLRQRYARNGNPGDLEAAISAYRNSCALDLATQTEQLLASARAWATWATARRSWSEAAEANGIAVGAARKLFEAQVVRRHKESWLRETRGLHHEAGYAIAMAGDARAAVRSVEDGRAMLLSEALDRERADLQRLTMLGRPDLADRYREAANRLVNLSRVLEPPPTAPSSLLTAPGAKTRVS
jgi:tetratricopeptide (TPR) repeat protein